MKNVKIAFVVLGSLLSGCDGTPIKGANTASPQPSATPTTTTSASKPKATSSTTTTTTTTAAAAPSAPNPKPPSMAPVSQTGSESHALSFNVNASDPQGQALSYLCVSGCPSGLNVAAGSGVVSWTPSFGQAGVYHPLIQATNTSNLDIQASVQITIAHTPRAPNLTSISAQSVNTGATLNLTPVCSSPDSEAVTVSMSNLPVNSSFSAGTFSFSPDYTQAAQYTPTVTCTDNVNGLQATESVTITVNYQGTAPVMSAVSSQSANQQQAISFSVSATSADGATLNYSATNLPVSATFVGQAFNWTPSCGQAGSYTPTFTVTDSSDSLQDSKTPTITVNSADQYTVTWNAASPPSLSGTSSNSTNAFIGGVSYLGGGSLTYTYLADYDCNNHTWTKTFNSATKTLALTNPLGASDPGMHSFLVAVQDACGTINYRFVQVTGYSGSFSIQSSNQGSTYSTAGLCGGGTVYAH